MAYAVHLAFQLEQAGIPLLHHVSVPVFYTSMPMLFRWRAVILVADIVILQIKAVPALLTLHEARLLTYLRMRGLSVRLLMNFQALRLKDGLKRLVASPGYFLSGPAAASALEN